MKQVVNHHETKMSQASVSCVTLRFGAILAGLGALPAGVENEDVELVIAALIIGFYEPVFL